VLLRITLRRFADSSRSLDLARSPVTPQSCTRKEKMCRIHGGAPASRAPFGRRNVNYRHFSAEAKEQRRRL